MATEILEKAVGIRKAKFCDCFAYALAKEFCELLLFKGGDFAHTDIVSALPAER
jgi:ribonuclease VapC